MKRPPVALVLVLVLVGFLLVVTGTATSVASQNEAPRKKALIDQILERRQDVDDRDLAVAQLRGDVAEAQDAASRRSANEQERVQGEKELAALAGTTAVKGRGLTVKLSDAPRSADAEPAKFDSSRIQDSDIQLVVNALFATGAEAIAVNDNRVVAVTPIRAAGGTIVVNYRPVSSPYRISAIGVDEKRFKSSDIVAQLEQWEDKFNLGFSIDDDGDMTIPAYAGRVGIDQSARHADLDCCVAGRSRRTELTVLAFAGLLVGALVAYLLQPEVPQEATRYVAMVVVAAIDASFGGIRSWMEQTFNDRIFLISFVINALVAAVLVWVGDQLAADVSTAIVVVFGIRIFQNVAAIRRRIFGG